MKYDIDYYLSFSLRICLGQIEPFMLLIVKDVLSTFTWGSYLHLFVESYVSKNNSRVEFRCSYMSKLSINQVHGIFLRVNNRVELRGNFIVQSFQSIKFMTYYCLQYYSFFNINIDMGVSIFLLFFFPLLELDFDCEIIHVHELN